MLTSRRLLRTSWAPALRSTRDGPLLGGVLALALFLALASPTCRPAAPATAAGWNLLLVTLDTLRADRLGSYGRAAADTPALDALAAAGVRFDQAQSAMPLTLPSHATLLTGLLPPRHGLRDNGQGSLPADVPSLAAHLHAAGYRTAAFVGAFVLDRRYGLARGFATYDDEVPRVPGRLEAERPGAVVVDRALAWLVAGAPAPAAQAPFFAWVHLYDAHAPYAPAEPWAGRHPGDRYQGEVAMVDAQVGRLLTWLDQHGLAGRTVVAVAGDHGEGLGEHGEDTHGVLLYQSTLRVPLLLRAPGVLAPRVVDEPVGLADLAPTLAGLLGRPLAGALDGRDLSAPLVAGAPPPRGDLYAESRYAATFGWSALAALRRGRLKYVAAPRAELYDLASDPGENRDLRGQRRREAAALEQALAALAAEQRAAAPAASDPESRALLQSLGYVAPDGAPAGGSGRDPKDAMPLFRAYELAFRAEQEGRLQDAAEKFKTLISEDPGNPVFLAAYGRVLRDLDRMAEALTVYRQAAALAPESPQVWYELATALQRAGKHEEARHAFEQVLRRDPERPDARNGLGIALAGEGLLTEAHEQLRRAVDADPRNAQMWNNLGNVLRDQGREEEAAAAYRRAIDLDPRDPDAFNGLGALEVARDRPVEGLALFERVLLLAPDHHEARLNRAIALELSGRREEAVNAYRDFLVRTAGEDRYAAQRQAARQLLARLGARPPTN